MSIDQIPRMPDGLHARMHRAIEGGSELARTLMDIRSFIEAVMLDEESEKVGLWQGEWPARAMKKVYRALELACPIAGMSEELSDDVVVFRDPADTSHSLYPDDGYERTFVDGRLVSKRWTRPWPRPIPVSERLPEIDPESCVSESVLAFSETHQTWHVGVLTQWSEHESPRWSFEHPPIDGDEIAAWLPLPPPISPPTTPTATSPAPTA